MPWSTNSMSRYDAGGPAARRSHGGEERMRALRRLRPARRQERFARFTNPAIKVR